MRATLPFFVVLALFAWVSSAVPLYGLGRDECESHVGYTWICPGVVRLYCKCKLRQPGVKMMYYDKNDK
ncbi:hypothetical protein GE061_018839 [Apolygus lucorum]|uniref:Uncharacterized protein n=1 Tax=Apolygus lucorum TaxID=248454 RepID=A0A6A4JFJ4_APOLU|nr:hypothetical protein GE061_018839 [Apolygus lucorum]